MLVGTERPPDLVKRLHLILCGKISNLQNSYKLGYSYQQGQFAETWLVFEGYNTVPKNLFMTVFLDRELLGGFLN